MCGINCIYMANVKKKISQRQKVNEYIHACPPFSILCKMWSKTVLIILGVRKHLLVKLGFLPSEVSFELFLCT